MTSLVAAGLLAPVIEELVFRGMLFRAWERDWGWLRAAIASSFVFAFMHPAVYISQFVAGLIFVCLYRRTGSLRAAIVMHAIYNVSLWYPLAGRFVLPAGRESGRLDVWMPNLVCLGLTYWDFRPFVENNPAIAWGLLQSLAGRLRAAQHQA